MESLHIQGEQILPEDFVRQMNICYKPVGFICNRATNRVLSLGRI